MPHVWDNEQASTRCRKQTRENHDWPRNDGRMAGVRQSNEMAAKIKAQRQYRKYTLSQALCRLVFHNSQLAGIGAAKAHLVNEEQQPMSGSIDGGRIRRRKDEISASRRSSRRRRWTSQRPT
ncbi:hypothetical protein E4U35_000255 [Claviceps purpurea]|nr:hypothetical protein E4U35_000255 [Claviceps purpurea]